MKVNKTISLEWELIEKLRGVNASSLINELLLDYFGKQTKKNQFEGKSIEELEELIDIAEKKEKAENELKELNEQLSKRGVQE